RELHRGLHVVLAHRVVECERVAAVLDEEIEEGLPRLFFPRRRDVEEALSHHALIATGLHPRDLDVLEASSIEAAAAALHLGAHARTLLRIFEAKDELLGAAVERPPR